MNKESIYRIIGYQGEYSPSVKKALKKLLREYHPDHHGDKEVFQLITEVKKELETNTVSYKHSDSKVKNKLEDLDYEYCYMMLKKMSKERKQLKEELENKYQERDKINLIYKDLYYKKVDVESKTLNNGLKNSKSILLILLVLILISFLVAVFKNSTIIFILFGILCFICILVVFKYLKDFDEITKQSNKEIQKYKKAIKEINDITIEKQNIDNDIINMERNLKKVENDLRFYNNLLK